MRMGGVRGAGGAPQLLIALAIMAVVSGCAGTGQPTAGARGTTMAFESIDGPPPAVFRKLVATLDQEAQARRVTVVSREGAASYRVRCYLSAQVERGKTSIAWVWDVYDPDRRRALRISGEEPTGPKGPDAWATADEAVLRRIAHNGMERIAGFLNSPEPSPAIAPPPEPGAAAVAAIGPNSAGPVRTASMAQ